ncbi:MAG TPA: PilZ domain-containing protein [Terriglobales bacterium]|nr:PilZ domain-containing protein [Terriglobales bacterium]
MIPSPNTRRWQRHDADLPVRVVISDGDSRTRVAGRGTEISEGGMAVFAGVDLKPYDLMELEFEAPSHARVIAVIRNRSGYCFGLEFLTPLSPEQETNGGESVGEKKKLPAPVSSSVVSEFEKIRGEKGNAAAYAFLAEALQAAGCTNWGQQAAEQALDLFLRTKDSYLKEKEHKIARLRTEVEVLRRVAPLLADAQDPADPRVREIVNLLPDLTDRE